MHTRVFRFWRKYLLHGSTSNGCLVERGKQFLLITNLKRTTRYLMFWWNSCKWLFVLENKLSSSMYHGRFRRGGGEVTRGIDRNASKLQKSGIYPFLSFFRNQNHLFAVLVVAPSSSKANLCSTTQYFPWASPQSFICAVGQHSHGVQNTEPV